MKELIEERKILGKDLSLPNAYASTVLLCVSLGVGSILLQLLVMVGIFFVASKPPPTLVQTIEGESFAVDGIPASGRDSKAIQRFTGETLTLMLSWSGFVPPETTELGATPKPDPGVKLSVKEDNQTYLLPTTSWEASFALEPEFRQEFLPKLAQFVPESIFQGQTTTFYVPTMIGKPIPIGTGRWKLDVVGTIYVVRANNKLGDLISFNRTIYVRAVTPMYQQGIPKESQNNQLAHKVADIRQAALEIYAITNLEDKEIGE
jgi:hypothetical protein